MDWRRYPYRLPLDLTILVARVKTGTPKLCTQRQLSFLNHHNDTPMSPSPPQEILLSIHKITANRRSNMETQIISIITLVVLAGILLKLFVFKERLPGDSSQQMIDIKNQLVELKTKQLESQTASLQEQQKLFTATQTNLTKQLESIMQIVNDNLSKNQSNINTRLDTANTTISEVQKKLGSLETATRNIHDIGKDISSLQQILQSPKLRGNLGEYLLEELLKSILPAQNFAMQHPFKDNTVVDAVIRLGESLVPIDSKFPLESFQRLITTEDPTDRKKFKKEFIRAVRAKIDEIASKYIQPAENTFDFAMMYIPAENVYYEIIINDFGEEEGYKLFAYAMERHVIPVSPNSFYAYLTALVHGLKGLQSEKNAKQIMGELASVQTSFGKFYTEFSLVGKHLNNASEKFKDAQKRADKFNDKVGQITTIKSELVETSARIMIEGDV
jgi:DNA recombination protein RmuC